MHVKFTRPKSKKNEIHESFHAAFAHYHKSFHAKFTRPFFAATRRFTRNSFGIFLVSRVVSRGQKKNPRRTPRQAGGGIDPPHPPRNLGGLRPTSHLEWGPFALGWWAKISEVADSQGGPWESETSGSFAHQPGGNGPALQGIWVAKHELD